MKQIVSVLLMSIFLMFTTQLSAQNEVKVLMEDISGTYTGESKNGLAHGTGKSVGKDTYEGKFKNGLPNGSGIYTWANGDTYNGMWKAGKQNGNGTFTVIVNNEKIERHGVWKSGEFSKEVKKQPYKIDMVRNITRYTVRKIDDSGNQVTFAIMQAGTTIAEVDNLSITGDSGNKFDNGSMVGYENMQYPFSLKINYTTWNTLHTQQFDALFEITITEKGSYKIVLNH